MIILGVNNGGGTTNQPLGLTTNTSVNGSGLNASTVNGSAPTTMNIGNSMEP